MQCVCICTCACAYANFNNISRLSNKNFYCVLESKYVLKAVVALQNAYCKALEFEEQIYYLI